MSHKITMKKLYLILICLLTSCVTHINKPIKTTEKIYAFMIEKNKIYLIGEQSDYLLQNQDVEAMQHFLTSPYAKQTLFFTMKLDSLDNEITGEYTVYLDESKYSKEEKEQLQKQYWFNPISYIHSDFLSAVKLRNPNWKANQPALKRQYRAFGKRIRFNNRDEIISKFSMPEPIEISLVRRTSHKEVIADDIALELTAITLFTPVYVAYTTLNTAFVVPIAVTQGIIYILNKQSKK